MSGPVYASVRRFQDHVAKPDSPPNGFADEVDREQIIRRAARLLCPNRGGRAGRTSGNAPSVRRGRAVSDVAVVNRVVVIPVRPRRCAEERRTLVGRHAFEDGVFDGIAARIVDKARRRAEHWNKRERQQQNRAIKLKVECLFHNSPFILSVKNTVGLAENGRGK